MQCCKSRSINLGRSFFDENCLLRSNRGDNASCSLINYNSILYRKYCYAERQLNFVSFFPPRRFERAILKRPNTVRCLAVKCTLLRTRHPRKEKKLRCKIKLESLLACAVRFRCATQPEMVRRINTYCRSPSLTYRRGRYSSGLRKAWCRMPHVANL